MSFEGRRGWAGAVALTCLASAWAPTGASATPSAQQYFVRGNKALKGGDLERAREMFAQARSLAPDWYMTHLHWAIAELRLTPDSQDALTALVDVAATAPQNPRAWYYLGRAQESHERWFDAEASYRTALDLRPGIHDARFRLAKVLAQSERPELAVFELEEVLRDDPTHIACLTVAADLYEAAGRLEDAENALRQIARVQPSTAYHRYRLAEFFERTGQDDKAERARDRANAVDPRGKRRMRPLRPSRR